MAKTPSIYTRLTRPVAGLATRYSLWFAADHFMQVEASGYRERYQRFRFDEVQAFLIQPSRRRLYLMLIWMLPWFFAGISLLVGGGVVAAVFLALFSVFLLINWLLGSTHRVYIVTRVQIARINAIVRHRKINHALDRLRPLIEAAQAAPANVPKTPEVTAAPPPPAASTPEPNLPPLA